MTLCEGLLEMYATEGVDVARMEPGPGQTYESFVEDALAQTRLPSEGSPACVVMTCAKTIAQRTTGGRLCAVVVISQPSQILGLRGDDPGRSVATARTHLHKFVLRGDDDDPDVCVACLSTSISERGGGLQCDACFTTLCAPCIVKTAMGRSRCGASLNTHVCPGCRAETGMKDLVMSMPRVLGPSRGRRRHDSIILDAMRSLDTKISCLTILVDPAHGCSCGCGGDSATGRMAITAAGRGLRKHTCMPGVVRRVLRRRSTVFLVGALPTVDGDDGDLEGGKAFIVTRRRGTVEALDMFPHYALLAATAFHRETLFCVTSSDDEM